MNFEKMIEEAKSKLASLQQRLADLDREANRTSTEFARTEGELRLLVKLRDAEKLKSMGEVAAKPDVS